MTKEVIRFASFSDIHLGHPRTTTNEILSSLRHCLKSNKVYQNVDTLILAGDVFDRLLELNNPFISEIDKWIAEVILNCNKHNVTLLVLEGTKSHDRGQSQRWVTINELLGENGCKLYYVDTLSLEYIPELGMNILFVPDDLNTDSSITLAEVKELLKAKGLAKADMAIMHGQFKHQLPEIVISKSTVTHDNDEYLNLVKHYILIGHIHTHSVYGRILAQGSTDRLTHGEEEPKGFLMGEINLLDQNKDWFSFVENKIAKKYITINCLDLELEQALKKIDESIQELKDGSYVRIEAEKDSPIFANLSKVMELSPLLKWSKLIRNKEDTELVVKDNNELLTWEPIKVNRNNIISIIEDELRLAEVDKDTSELILSTIERIK